MIDRKNLVRRVWSIIGQKRQKQLLALLILMVLSSFAEVLSIGATLPFLAILSDPSFLVGYPILAGFLTMLGIDSGEYLLFVTALFCIAALASGVIRISLLSYTTRISHAIGADLSIGIYIRALYQPYIVHLSRNSSDVISAISNKTGALTYGIQLFLSMVASVVILTAILFTLFFINPYIAFIVFGGFGLIYSTIAMITRRSLTENSVRISRHSTQVIKALQEGLGGIRDVLIDGSQEVYCRIYQNSEIPLRKAQAKNSYLGQAPRYLTESLGMVFIALIAFIFVRANHAHGEVIPVLGALAVGAQRLMPLLQQIYQSWSGILGLNHSIMEAVDLLSEPLPSYALNSMPLIGGNYSVAKVIPMTFDKTITLKDVFFRYGDQLPWTLKNISIEIKKGSKVGFIGPTGSGKSTLLDIVMALFEPSAGTLRVDDVAINQQNARSWQMRIAHVPQSIYLSDASVAENIAFGVPFSDIDQERVRAAAAKAQIADAIEVMEHGYQTTVGERGIRLSGGQRQRIGIARALYKNADVIVFDEATSSLDIETEASIKEAIDSLGGDLTILIIAHRHTTLNSCSMIYRIDSGRIVQSGAPSVMLG